MRFAHKLLYGLGAELRAIFGVVPLLRRPFWMAWGLCFLLALVGLLPGAVAVFAQLLVLIGLGLGGLFSGFLAKRVRRRKWVDFPDGREVAPFLPQLITLLVGPAYFLAMLVLFARMAAVFPGLLPATGWLDALLLAMDNFLRTQVFFDTAECFHLRLDGRVEGVAGASLVFVSRFLMDLVFIKLAVQLFNAAYFRAQGLGRGEDKLFTIKREVRGRRRGGGAVPLPGGRRFPTRRGGHVAWLLGSRRSQGGNGLALPGDDEGLRSTLPPGPAPGNHRGGTRAARPDN